MRPARYLLVWAVVFGGVWWAGVGINSLHFHGHQVGAVIAVVGFVLMALALWRAWRLRGRRF